MEEDTDKKFVRGLFLVVSWCAASLPLIYEIWNHDWVNLALIIISQMGVVVYAAVKKTPKH